MKQLVDAMGPAMHEVLRLWACYDVLPRHFLLPLITYTALKISLEAGTCQVEINARTKIVRRAYK